MSELFNALQKLEEKNAPDSTPAPPPVSGNGEGKRKRVPYLRVLLLLLVVLLVTGLSLAFLWFQPDLPFFSKTVQQETVAAEEVLPESAEPLPAEVLPQTEVLDKNVVIEEIQIRDEKPGVLEDGLAKVEENKLAAAPQRVEISVTAVAEEQKAMDNQLQSIETLNQEFIAGKRQLQSVDKFHDIERERNLVQRKRLVYRAEKLRVHGDSAAALKLYQEAWSISPNAALANNMAAILISTEQYAQAEKFLQEGLQLTPEDTDLLYNLKIAQQGKKQNKY